MPTAEEDKMKLQSDTETAETVSAHMAHGFGGGFIKGTETTRDSRSAPVE
jgi:hypothetical protein